MYFEKDRGGFYIITTNFIKKTIGKMIKKQEFSSFYKFFAQGSPGNKRINSS